MLRMFKQFAAEPQSCLVNDYVAQSKNPKPTIELSLSPEEYHDLFIAKVSFRGIKKGFDFLVASHPLGASIQGSLNHRKTQQNVATSTHGL